MAKRRLIAQNECSNDQGLENNPSIPPVGLEPRSKLWIERGGKVVLSEWRVRLLEAIDQTGSLAKAAEVMNVPYRSAWQRMKKSEERLGIRLLDTQSGGADGGGTTLTEAARDLIRRYHRFSDGIAELVDERFRESFGR